MASAKYVVNVTASDGVNPIVAGATRETLRRLSNVFKALSSGTRPISGYVLDYRHGAVAGSGTITLASAVANTVVTVNGVDFPAIAGTGVVANNTWKTGVTDTDDAAALAAAINACTNTAISGVVTATSALGVVTLTSVIPGTTGNNITIETKGVLANGTITAAAVAAADTITINGVTLTSRQEFARATITLTSAVAGNTVTINGIVLTAAATAGSATFAVGVTDTADAASLAAVINAHPIISTLMTATSALGVVSLRALVSGTAPNAYTLTRVGSPIAVSAGTLTSGQATSATTWDYGDTNTQAAGEIARCINAATDALISGHVTATSTAAVVTVRAKQLGLRGNAVTIASSSGSTLAIGGSAARLLSGTIASSIGAQATGTLTISSGSGTVGGSINGVAITVTWASTDTATATALTAAINASTNALVLGHVQAASSGGVVTLTSVHGGVAGNAITLVASGTGVTASVARLTGGAAPTTVAVSAARLTSGTSTRTSVSF